MILLVDVTRVDLEHLCSREKEFAGATLIPFMPNGIDYPPVSTVPEADHDMVMAVLNQLRPDMENL